MFVAIHLFFVVDVILGMDEMYEIAQQAKYRFLGSVKYTKFAADEIYEIGQFVTEFEYEY